MKLKLEEKLTNKSNLFSNETGFNKKIENGYIWI